MAWVTLTEDHIRSRLAAAELTSLKSVETVAGQDVLADLIGQVTDEVRGYVEACSVNSLGADGTIPERLLVAAGNLVRYRLLNRLPLNAPALLEERRSEYRDAVQVLRDVAGCRFRVDDADPTSEPDRLKGAYGAAERVF